MIIFTLLDFFAFMIAAFFTTALALAIALGSRWFSDFDSALVGYTFASLFATFGIVYRYTVWLSKPSTRRYWQQSFSIFFNATYWKKGALPKAIIKAIVSRLILQDFILKRGKLKYIAHFLIAWGCALAAAVTFPLVFGWLHFEQGKILPEQTYHVVAFGIRLMEIPLNGFFAWAIFHALVISSFMVIPGVMLAFYRRMVATGETVIQRFIQDLIPLILLFLVAFSGLLLWINYEWMGGYYYSSIAHFHAVTVIGTLLYLPFGKLFHIFQRPASIGIALYRELMILENQAKCRLTNEVFAPKKQIEDLAVILPPSGLSFTNKQNNVRWQEYSPKAKRMIIGRVHSQTRNGKFN